MKVQQQWSYQSKGRQAFMAIFSISLSLNISQFHHHSSSSLLLPFYHPTLPFLHLHPLGYHPHHPPHLLTNQLTTAAQYNLPAIRIMMQQTDRQTDKQTNRHKIVKPSLLLPSPVLSCPLCRTVPYRLLARTTRRKPKPEPPAS